MPCGRRLCSFNSLRSLRVIEPISMAVEAATESARNFRYPAGSSAKGPLVKRDSFFFIAIVYHRTMERTARIQVTPYLIRWSRHDR